MRANEKRLERYLAAARPWAAAWRSLQDRYGGLGLLDLHRALVSEAEALLPMTPGEEVDDG